MLHAYGFLRYLAQTSIGHFKSNRLRGAYSVARR